MKSRIAIAISALTLGTALAAVPSFAQTRNQPNGTAAQSESCVHFQQGCSDKPYPMGQNASPNAAQNTERTGTQENRQARSASGGERINNARTSGSRERLSSRERTSVGVNERERVGVNERERLGVNERQGVSVGERERVAGETNGYGAPRYYNDAPGMRVAGADGGSIAWCETRFHSFDPATGTYMGFDGIRHACP
jgi:hypothetical protein